MFLFSFSQNIRCFWSNYQITWPQKVQLHFPVWVYHIWRYGNTFLTFLHYMFLRNLRLLQSQNDGLSFNNDLNSWWKTCHALFMSEINSSSKIMSYSKFSIKYIFAYNQIPFLFVVCSWTSCHIKHLRVYEIKVLNMQLKTIFHILVFFRR